MAKSGPKLKARKPRSALLKPLKADFKDLFKAASKAIGNTAAGRWVDAGANAVEALAALGLTTDPGELAFLLIKRSATLALFDLIGESAVQELAQVQCASDTLIEPYIPLIFRARCG